MTVPDGYLPYDPKAPMGKCPACAGPMVRKPPAVCIRCERKGIEAPQLPYEEDPW